MNLLDYININTLNEGVEYRFNCCYCSDKRRRLYIKIDNNKLLAHCFNCNFKLVKRIIHKPSNNIKQYYEYSHKKKLLLVDNIPAEYKQYLYQYGIDNNTILKYNFKYDLSTNRLAIAGLNGWLLRSIHEKPKWLNYGAKLFKSINKIEDKVILTEDVLSAIRISEDINIFTIALLSTTLNNETKALINKYKFKKIFIWLDKDKAGLNGSLKIKKLLTFFDTRIILSEEAKKLTKQEIINIKNKYNI